LFELAARVAGDFTARVLSMRGASIIWLVLVVLGMFLLVGLTSEWHHGAAQGSVLVDIVWHAVWVAYQILKTLLIVLLVVLAYRRFVEPRDRHQT
jgi:hypothetical protein